MYGLSLVFLKIHGDFRLILNYLENYINNTLIMNWSRSSYQCSANSDESKQMSEDELIFLDIRLYELRHMTIILEEKKNTRKKKNIKQCKSIKITVHCYVFNITYYCHLTKFI
jgi:hypothetical protein